MKKNSEILELVGHLQVTDQPLLSLYVTQSDGVLYFFYRLKKNEYYLTKVTPHEVIAYLDEKMGLAQIYMGSDDYLYHHQARHEATISDFMPIEDAKRKKLQNRIMNFDKYDDVFGLDEIRVRHYLKDKMFAKESESHKKLVYG